MDKHVVRELRVLTYNTYLRPPFVTCTGFLTDDYKAERLNLIADSLSQYDLVGLQEVFSTGSYRQQQLIDQAKQHGFAYHLNTRDRNFFFTGGIDGGLLLLSKLPIVSSAEMYYETGTHADYYCDKGALYAKIELPNNDQRFLHVFLTHTQASYVANPTLADPSTQIRLAQLKKLQHFMHEHLPQGEPALLLGDLNINGRAGTNISSSSAEYQAFLDVLTADNIFTVQDLLLDKHNGEHPVTFGDPAEAVISSVEDRGHLARLDYIIWLTPGASSKQSEHRIQPDVSATAVEPFRVIDLVPDQAASTPFTHLSDHYGISTKLLLK